jgi:NACHT domain
LFSRNDVDLLSIRQSERFDELERIGQAIVNTLINNDTNIKAILQLSNDEQFVRIDGKINESSVAIQKNSSSEHQQTRSRVRKEIERHDLLKKEEAERREIAGWLSSNNSSRQQYDIFRRREEGTGLWLLNDNRFKRWLTGSEHTLICPGMPGAGKTVIASIVIDHLWNHFQADNDIGVAHLYCSYKRQQEQTCASIIADILGQLVRQRTSLPKIVKDLYQRHIRQTGRPQLEEVSQALQLVAGSFSRVFFVIDALDESTTTDGTRQRLLSEMFRLQSLDHISTNLLITSRFIPEDIGRRQDHIEIEIRAKNEDVEKYIKGQIPRLPSCVSKRSDLQDAIKVAIFEAADGMSVKYHISEKGYG